MKIVHIAIAALVGLVVYLLFADSFRSANAFEPVNSEQEQLSSACQKANLAYTPWARPTGPLLKHRLEQIVLDGRMETSGSLFVVFGSFEETKKVNYMFYTRDENGNINLVDTEADNVTLRYGDSREAVKCGRNSDKWVITVPEGSILYKSDIDLKNAKINK